MDILQSTNERHSSITELASEFGITTRTIRHYEDEGLLSPRREGKTACSAPATGSV